MLPGIKLFSTLKNQFCVVKEKVFAQKETEGINKLHKKTSNEAFIRLYESTTQSREIDDDKNCAFYSDKFYQRNPRELKASVTFFG